MFLLVQFLQYRRSFLCWSVGNILHVIQPVWYSFRFSLWANASMSSFIASLLGAGGVGQKLRSKSVSELVYVLDERFTICLLKMTSLLIKLAFLCFRCASILVCFRSKSVSCRLWFVKFVRFPVSTHRHFFGKWTYLSYNVVIKTLQTSLEITAAVDSATPNKSPTVLWWRAVSQSV